jgi:hypothetical protein
MEVLGPDFPYRLQRAQFSGSAADLAPENQAYKQQEFWGLTSLTGFREHTGQWLCCWIGSGKPSM